MKKYKENYDKCPNCNKLLVLYKDINRILKNILFAIEFNCPLKCGNIFTYEKKESHINECLFIKCLFCEKKIKKIEFAQHYEKCNKKPFYCNEAQIYFPKDLKEIYIKQFKKIIVYYAQLIKDLLSNDLFD